MVRINIVGFASHYQEMVNGKQGRAEDMTNSPLGKPDIIAREPHPLPWRLAEHLGPVGATVGASKVTGATRGQR